MSPRNSVGFLDRYITQGLVGYDKQSRDSKIGMSSGEFCQIKPFYIHRNNRILPPIQEQVFGFIKERLHPTLRFAWTDINQLRQL